MASATLLTNRTGALNFVNANVKAYVNHAPLTLLAEETVKIQTVAKLV